MVYYNYTDLLTLKLLSQTVIESEFVLRNFVFILPIQRRLAMYHGSIKKSIQHYFLSCIRA